MGTQDGGRQAPVFICRDRLRSILRGGWNLQALEKNAMLLPDKPGQPGHPGQPGFDPDRFADPAPTLQIMDVDIHFDSDNGMDDGPYVQPPVFGVCGHMRRISKRDPDRAQGHVFDDPVPVNAHGLHAMNKRMYFGKAIGIGQDGIYYARRTGDREFESSFHVGLAAM